ncbi:hypothetical protein T01_2260 [Trichinella spiralis]|uniref:Secreted protein n=1 Tax=Trichinella spiralis TaxID=6334 RepID=A0A0V1B442_TRISP|nr:hypothetical protein T01_2260 [Trichinella spiralis]
MHVFIFLIMHFVFHHAYDDWFVIRGKIYFRIIMKIWQCKEERACHRMKVDQSKRARAYTFAQDVAFLKICWKFLHGEA